MPRLDDAEQEPYDVLEHHLELLLDNANLSANTLIRKLRTNYFIVTPESCDGSNYKTLATNESYWMKFAANAEVNLRIMEAPFKRAKDTISGWPDDELQATRILVEQYEKNRDQIDARDTEEDRRLTTAMQQHRRKRRRGDNLPAHEDGGAKTCLRAGIPRFITLTKGQLDLVIDLTHSSPKITLSRIALRTWFKDFIGNFATRALDWIEVRLFLTLLEIGRNNVDRATADQRMELWYFIFEMYPISILSGLFSENAGCSFDFAAVYGDHRNCKDVKEAWRGFLKHLFALLCELTLFWVFAFTGESEACQKAARSQRKLQYETMVRTDPTLLSLSSKLGGLGDVPVVGFKGKSSLIAVPGSKHNIAKPCARPRGQRRSAAEALHNKKRD